jgi:hypothetical protein
VKLEDFCGIWNEIQTNIVTFHIVKQW